MSDPLEEAIIGNLRVTSGLPLRLELEGFATPQIAVDGDTPQIAAAGESSRWLRVWRNSPCLVASRRQSRMQGFPLAAAQSASDGWPVAVRRSGGTTVVHRPGILNVSLVSLSSGDSNLGVRQDYLALLGALAKALAPLGIPAEHGSVDGAHCDGDYNLVWQGRKLAGTAGFVGRMNGMKLRVFHATLAVRGDLFTDLAAIENFETALGENPLYDRKAHVSVAGILAVQTQTRPTPNRAALTGEWQ